MALWMRTRSRPPSCKAIEFDPFRNRIQEEHLSEGMQRFDLAPLCGEPQRLRADAEQGGGPRQVHPPFGLGHLGMIDRDFVVAAKRCHPFAGPAIAVSGAKIIT